MAFTLSIAALLVGWSGAVNLVAPLRRLYVPVNVALAALLVLAARWRGLEWVDLGLHPQTAAAGLGWGLLAAAVITAVLGVLLARRQTRGLLRDERVAGHSAGDAARWALVRIPLGTVALEEIAFRGVLLAAWAADATLWAAVASSSAIFGLWHIVPTAQTLKVNWPRAPRASVARGVAAGVLLTMGGGVALCWLRLVSGSLLAPILAHIAANSLSVAAAFWAHRRHDRAL